MKTVYYILVFSLLFCGCGKGTKKQKEEVLKVIADDFEDPLFYNYMQAHYDTNNDYVFQREEILAVKSLDLTKETSIFSLKGFEKFIALETLNISGLSLQSDELEIKNPRLWNLNCSNTGLSSLYLSESHELKIVDCSNNSIRELAFGAHLNLEELNCSKNLLVELHLKYNTKLRVLNVYNNLRLSELELGSNSLSSLICTATNLRWISIRYFEKLKELECGEKIESLDIGGNRELEYLSFYINDFSTLDITNNVKLKKIKITSSSVDKSFIFYIKQGQEKPQIEAHGVASYEFQYK